MDACSTESTFGVVHKIRYPDDTHLMPHARAHATRLRVCVCVWGGGQKGPKCDHMINECPLISAAGSCSIFRLYIPVYINTFGSFTEQNGYGTGKVGEERGWGLRVLRLP